VWSYFKWQLVHKSRGKYTIVDDATEGKYLDSTVNASDIIQVVEKLYVTLIFGLKYINKYVDLLSMINGLFF
jgi:hypothetical protein